MSAHQVNFEHCARRCFELHSSNEYNALLQMVTEIRDNIEVIHSTEYSSFLQFLFPVFYNIVRQGIPIQFDSNSTEQKIRNIILEILNKLPNNELLKPQVQHLLQLSMYLLEVDNEENALICLRIIMELHKNYRPNLESEVQPFLNIVQKMFGDLPLTVDKVFKQPPIAGSTTALPTATTGAGSTTQTGTSTPGITSPPSQQPVNTTTTSTTTPATTTATSSSTNTTSSPPLAPSGSRITPSMSSFKVITECPVIVVLLFQLYPSSIASNVPKFIPLIINSLALSPPPTVSTTHHSLYVDFIAAQVKTLSFLAYILKQHMDLIRPYAETLPKYVIQLLQSCPSQSAAIRKELLVATRYILSSDLKVRFINYLDMLLDEKILIGTSKTSYESLRFIAYSSLADFIHHMRQELSLSSIAKVVTLYSKHLHDSANHFGIQTISAKLFISIVEFIPRKADPEFKARAIIYKIFESFINKFVSLKKQIPILLQQQQQLHQQQQQQQQQQQNVNTNEEGSNITTTTTTSSAATTTSSSTTTTAAATTNTTVTPPATTDTGMPFSDPVKDCRGLLKCIIGGFRNIVWALNACPSQRPIMTANGQQNLRIALPPVDESLMYIKLFKNLVKCLPIYGGINPMPNEEKENLEHYANTLVQLEYRMFQELFTSVIGFLYEKSVDDQTLLIIPQVLLISQPIPSNNPSKVFSDILAPFLNEKLKKLTPNDKPDPCLMRLLKHLFGSIQSANNEVEPAIQSILSSLMVQTVKLAIESKHTDSPHYFMLLKIIFRNCTKPDLTKDITLLFPTILESLNELLNSSYPQEMIYLFIELALTVPLRFTSFLPYIHLLVRPLIMALQSSSSDLLSIAFKTIELLVDNVTGDFLLNVFKENKAEFLHAIWIHLKPAPYFFGPHAVRVLGKLAGKSRSLTLNSGSPPLITSSSTQSSIENFRILLPIDNATNSHINVPFDKAIEAASNLLYNQADTFLQQNAFNLLRSAISLKLSTVKESLSSHSSEIYNNIQSKKQNDSSTTIIFNQLESTDPLPLPSPTNLTNLAASTSSSSPVSPSSLLNPYKSKEDYFEEVKTMKSLFTGFYVAFGSDCLKIESRPFLTQLINSFMLMMSTRPINNILSSDELDPRIIIDSFIDLISRRNNESKNILSQDDQFAILEIYYNVINQIYGESADGIIPPIFKYFIESFINNCYHHYYGNKSAACTGIQFFVNKYQENKSWIAKYQVPMLKALLFVIDDVTYAGYQPLIDYASEIVEALVKASIPKIDPIVPTSDQMEIDTSNPTSNVNSSTINSTSNTTSNISSPVSPLNPTSNTESVLTPSTSMDIEQNTPLSVQLNTPSTNVMADGPQQTPVSISSPSSPTTPAPVPPSPATVTTPATTSTASTTTGAMITTPHQPMIVPPQSVPPPQPVKPHATLAQLDESQRMRMKDLIEYLFRLLFSPQAHTRKFVQQIIQLISNITNIPIHMLHEDPRSFFLNQLPKSLKTISVYSQTATIDAITFCISQKVSMLPFNQESLKFIQDCLMTSSGEEPSNTVKANSQKNINLLSKLRQAGLEMAATCMACTEFVSYDGIGELMNRMIRVFFKTVTVRQPEAAAIAKRGLHLAISQNRIHRELLLFFLKPVLTNLTDPKSISVPFLQGLSRLLELLSTCFNAALGERLFEYLKKYEATGKLSQAANRFKETEEVRICAAIIDTFHLLPTAGKLLEQTTVFTLKLEQQLGREVNSPYRAPLIRFLSKYPQRAVDIFINQAWTTPHLADLLPQYSTTFRLIVKAGDIARPIVDELAKNYSSWIDVISNRPPEYQFLALSMINTIVKIIPNWLTLHRPVLDKLIEIWRNPVRQQQLVSGDITSPNLLKETRMIAKCFIQCCRLHHAENELLFHLLFAFTIRGPSDFAFLRDFFQTELTESTTVEQKLSILSAYLEFARASTTTPELKVHAIQNIVTPLVTSYFALDPSQRSPVGSELFTNLARQSLPLETEQIQDEMLLIELLQLETLLIKNAPLILIDSRKELIKFAWNHFKNEDFTCRQTAYVLACRFIEAYETPSKIVLQVYVQLLKAFQLEAKHLVKQALDILVPVLKTRLVGDAIRNTWIKWTKKIIVEESHSPLQLVHILQLIVRHPVLFYPSRAQFIPQMVSSLPKLGLVSNISPENKKLSIDLTELIITWEKWRLNPSLLPNTAGGSTSNAHPPPPPPGSTPSVPPVTPTTEVSVTTPSQQVTTPITQADDEYRPPPNVIEHILQFLIRLMTNATDSKNAVLVEKCSDLLRQSLSIWPDASIKFSAFEKSLNNDQVLILSTTLNILNIVLEYQVTTFVPSNIANLPSFLPAINKDNPKISQLICSILKKMLTAFPLDKDTTHPEIINFYNSVSSTIGWNLGSFEKSLNTAILTLVTVFKEESSDWIDPHLSNIVKIIHKLTSFLLAPDTIPMLQTPTQPTPQQPQQGQQQPPQQQQNQQQNVQRPGSVPLKPAANVPQVTLQPKRTEKEIIDALIKSFNLIKSKIFKLSVDQKKIFLQSILVLLERHNDIELLTECLSITTKLITQKEYAGILQSKEKVNFILKMSRFGQLESKDLIASYFNLIHQVYSDPTSSRVELSQLESGFMLGLRSHDPKIRKGLFEILNRSISSTPYQRLNYIVAVQQWDQLGNTYWIRHALDLLMAILPVSKSVTLVTGVSKFETPNAIGQSDVALNMPSSFSELLSEIDEWLENVSPQKVVVGDIISSLRELTFSDSQLCHSLWVSIFSSIWSKLSRDEHYKLSKSLTTLLAKDYNKSPNVIIPPTNLDANHIIQTLLEGISKCSPQPKIPVEILSYLGETYNAFYTSIKMLEYNILEGTKTPEQTEPVWDALGKLYSTLNEQDLHFGLLRRRFTCDETKLGLLLEQFYMFQSAQEVYLTAMNKYSSNGAKATSKNENLIWEDHWIECAKRLNQWEVLLDYARSQNMNELLVESSWKLSAWPIMKEALTKLVPLGDTSFRKILQGYSLIIDKKFTEADPNIVNSNQLILKKWISLPERSFHAHNQGLIEMQQVVELQEAVHLLKEVTFSTSNLHTAPPARQVLLNTINDVKTIFSIWRERLPSKDEDTGVWNDLLTWRQQVFGLLNQGVEQISEFINAGQPAGTIKPIVLPETSWTTNKYAHVTRKHHIIEVCLNSLSKMFNLQIEVQDIFLNLKEQIKCYLQLPTHYETGISIINGTNLDYFLPLQKSEFFQLKGEFQSRLGQSNEANLNFSTAIQLYDNYSKSWVNWGYFCDKQFTNDAQLDPEMKASWAESAINCYIQGIRCDPKCGTKLLPRILWLLYLNGCGEVPHTHPNQQQSANTNASTAAAAAAAGATTTAATPAATPTTTATPTTPTSSTASSTPSNESQPTTSTTTPTPASSTPTTEVKKPSLSQMVFSSIEKTGAMIIPHWLWLSFIPSLVTGAYMSAHFPAYGFLCWQLTSKICCIYPSQTYYHFRKLVSEIKNNPKHPVLVPPTSSTPSVLKMAETLSVGIQPYHTCLINEIDTMLNGLIQFVNTIPAVHHFTASLNHILTEAFRVQTSEEIPNSLKEMIKLVYQHYFEQPQSHQQHTSSQQLVYENSTQLIEEYKQEFENDFGYILGITMDTDLTNSSGKTLTNFIIKLIEWVQRKQSTSLCTVYTQNSTQTVANYYNQNSFVRLENSAPTLYSMRPTLLEVPSLYRGIRDPGLDYSIRVEKLGMTAQMVKNSNGMLCPRITYYASNGHVYHYLVDIDTPLFPTKQATRNSERRYQFICSINNILLKYRETRRRGITFTQYPSLIPINSQLNLIQSLGGNELTPLIKVWSGQLPEQELYSPLLMYRNKVLGGQQISQQPTPELAPTNSVREKSHKPTKLQSFREMSKYMSDSLLSNFIHRNISTYQDQYEFKLAFASQWGLHSLTSYILFSRISTLSPSDIYFSKANGSVYFGKWASDVCLDTAEFTENGIVPFRLTQNIRTFLNPVFIEGGYQSSLIATAMCFSEAKEQLVNLLSCYLLDEVICWFITDQGLKQQSTIPQNLYKEMIDKTVSIINQMLNTRINVITPPTQPDKTLFLTPIIKKVNELIQLSSNSSNISQMESISYPWL